LSDAAQSESFVFTCRGTAGFFSFAAEGPMIYDCFTFFNELELLELRLHELADVADKFVLVEATKTHSNKSKPLYYRENHSRFGEFHDKIIHIIVDDLPDAKDPWVLENYQRNCIARGLVNCRPDDFVLVSDLDEIPRATTVAKVSRGIRFRDDFFSSRAHAALNSRWVHKIFHRRGFRRTLRYNHPFVLKFRQSQYKHFMNCRVVQPPFGHGTRMLYFRDFSCAEEIRHSGFKIVENGGWHFSWMGDVQRVQEKLAAYAHQEWNLPQFADAQHIRQAINEGRSFFGGDKRHEFVPLDASFPRYLLEHPEKFSSWIKPV
jgi:beta-1,4-mannosyl-glycoprotein beta-1,4-N-acetylglucosaminyltransferase